ncbi:MAG: transposase [Rickettsiales bacterium]|nr:transposase [Rickettsiales bacterium]
MLQRLRHGSKNLFKQEFKGTVEIDEAYLGESETNRHSLDIKLKGQKENVVIIGMINRETGIAKAMKVLSSEKYNEGRTTFKMHINSIEGYWSLLKRGINGTYHWVSKKNINKYINEFSFRYNSRNESDTDRFKMFCNNLNGKLLY